MHDATICDCTTILKNRFLKSLKDIASNFLLFFLRCPKSIIALFFYFREREKTRYRLRYGFEKKNEHLERNEENKAAAKFKSDIFSFRTQSQDSIDIPSCAVNPPSIKPLEFLAFPTFRYCTSLVGHPHFQSNVTLFLLLKNLSQSTIIKKIIIIFSKSILGSRGSENFPHQIIDQ